MEMVRLAPTELILRIVFCGALNLGNPGEDSLEMSQFLKVGAALAT